MEKLYGKRLLLLGGSLWKDEIKKIAKKNNITLIAVGNNPSSGIFEIAHESYIIDSTDTQKMKKIILEKKIDGVYMGGSEPVISSAIEYLEDLNYPTYCNKNQWEILQNKINFKKLCIEHNLPVAKQYFYNLKEIQNGLIKIDYPVITKPADSSGSNGFSIVNSYSELEEGYRKAQNYSFSKTVIIEQYIKHKSLVVFYTISGGEVYFSGIEDKYSVNYEEQNSYVAGLHLFESDKKHEFRKKFEYKIKKMFKNIGLQEGSVWFEIFYDNRDYYFNEAGYRYSGSVTIYPINYFYKINQLETDIYYALTGESHLVKNNNLIKENIPSNKKYAIYSIHLSEGQITYIEGIDRILKMKNIVSICATKNIGDTINSTGTVSQVFAFVHFVYDREEDFLRIKKKILETIIVRDVNNQDMINDLLDLSLIKI